MACLRGSYAWRSTGRTWEGHIVRLNRGREGVGWSGEGELGSSHVGVLFSLFFGKSFVVCMCVKTFYWMQSITIYASDLQKRISCKESTEVTWDKRPYSLSLSGYVLGWVGQFPNPRCSRPGNFMHTSVIMHLAKNVVNRNTGKTLITGSLTKPSYCRLFQEYPWPSSTSANSPLSSVKQGSTERTECHDTFVKHPVIVAPPFTSEHHE